MEFKFSLYLENPSKIYYKYANSEYYANIPYYKFVFDL